MRFKKNIKSFAFSISVLLGTTNSVFAMNTMKKDTFKIIHNISFSINNGKNNSPSFLGNKRKSRGLVKPDFTNLEKAKKNVKKHPKYGDYLVCFNKKSNLCYCDKCKCNLSGKHSFIPFSINENEFADISYCKSCIEKEYLKPYISKCLENMNCYSLLKKKREIPNNLSDKERPVEFYLPKCIKCGESVYSPSGFSGKNLCHKACLKGSYNSNTKLKRYINIRNLVVNTWKELIKSTSTETDKSK